MNREEVKKLLPIMQEWVEGKVIQFRCKTGEWLDIINNEFDFILSPDDYRIKPEPKYRPFKSIKECIIEMLNHPDIGFILHKDNGKKEHIKIGPRDIDYLLGQGHCNYDLAFVIFTFTDGEPFGVKEE